MMEREISDSWSRWQAILIPDPTDQMMALGMLLATRGTEACLPPFLPEGADADGRLPAGRQSNDSGRDGEKSKDQSKQYSDTREGPWRCSGEP